MHPLLPYLKISSSTAVTTTTIIITKTTLTATAKKKFENLSCNELSLITLWLHNHICSRKTFLLFFWLHAYNTRRTEWDRGGEIEEHGRLLSNCHDYEWSGSTKSSKSKLEWMLVPSNNLCRILFCSSSSAGAHTVREFWMFNGRLKRHRFCFACIYVYKNTEKRRTHRHTQHSKLNELNGIFFGKQNMFYSWEVYMIFNYFAVFFSVCSLPIFVGW